MKLIILYGSQTGNAQDLGERVWKQAKKFQIEETLLCPMDKFVLSEDTLSNTNETRFIFICSTTGQGEVPDNMNKFWKFIMKRSLPSDLFSKVQFSTIGLGDSSYDQYNFIAKKLYKRMIQLGGKPVSELCLCDDQNNDGIEGTFSKWIQNYWLNTFDSNRTLKFQEIASAEKNELILKYKINILPNVRELNVQGSMKELTEVSENFPFNARLTKNERVTSEDHWQNTRLLEFDCSDLNNPNLMRYEPGDVLMLRPSNFQQNIQKFYEIFAHLNLESMKNNEIDIRLNFDGNHSICVPDFLANRGPSPEEPSINPIRTVGDLIEKYFDLNSQPRMSFFEVFSQLATDEMEKEKLEEFTCSDDGGDGLEELYNYCYRPRRKIIEVFYDFPKTCENIKSLDVLLELIPSIKPRAFSIASSPHVHNDKIQILAAVVEYKTRLYETRKGTCSYWLSTLDPSAESNLRIPIWIKKGSFKFDWNKPLICVGPGTGVAPFRSILNEKIKRLNTKENFLYFGCRSPEADFYFREEWEHFVETKHLELNVAFSQRNGTKEYVQDLMLKNSEQIFHLIDKLEVSILIAGSSNRMPQDVLAILEKICKENLMKGNSEDQDFDRLASEYVKKLETAKRIQLETWS